MAAPEGRRRRPGGSFDFLRLPAVWKCFAFFFIFAVALGGLQSFAPQAAGVLHGVPAAQVAMCLSIYMAAAAGRHGARRLPGARSARSAQGRRRSVSASRPSVALLIGFGQWPAWLVPVLFGAMGFGAGIAGPSRDLLVKRATPDGATGRVYGVVYSGLDIGQAIAPLVFGALMDAGQHRWSGSASPRRSACSWPTASTSAARAVLKAATA